MIFINEIHYDNSGADENEGIELAGIESADLDGWSLVLYNGNNGSVYNTINLSGVFTNETEGYGFISFPISGIQNGSPDGIALVNALGDVVQFLSYEGVLTAVDGPASGLLSEDIQQSESGGTLGTQSLQLFGTGITYTDFTWGVPTTSSFGSVNDEQFFGEPIDGGTDPDTTPEESIVFINEIHYDNVGSDVNEGVELVGTESTNLDGWSLVLYNGNNGSVYNTINLSGVFADETNGYGFISFPISGIQNGSPDAVALVNDSGEIVQFLSYEGVLTAIDGPASGLLSEDIQQSESGSTLATESLQLFGTGTVYTDFTWGVAKTNTFGSINESQVFGEDDGQTTTPETTTLIHDIQGDGILSPLVGQLVTVEGIVVGDYQSGQGLFFVQEEASDVDSNELTSEGIAVSTTAFEVNEGDLVQVTGVVTENFDNTELQSITNVTVLASNLSLPTATSVSLPFSNEDFPERYEGMLVDLSQDLIVTSTFSLGRFGELVVSSEDRLFQPTHIALPGAEAAEIEAQNNLNQIILDDAITTQNPDPLIFPQGGLSFENTLRAGTTVKNAKGCMGYSFGAYRVFMSESPNFVDTNPRTDTPDEVGGNLKIASFNVLNYFNGDGNGGGFPTARGADTFEEFVRQRAKIINAITAMDVDVLGLIEIENDGYGEDSAIQDLVNGVNEALGNEIYSFINPGVEQIGTDAIAVGFIYKLATVSLKGAAEILDASVDPNFIDTSNRPALAQTFVQNETNEVITVSVNHFKSKGSNCNALGDPDTGDGQGNCNLTRLAAANALTTWLATDPTNSESDNFLIIGDLNAYAMEDPILAIEAAGYTNLINSFGGEKAYSFQFAGQFGYLDYALASNALADKVVGTTDWHINSDEPVVFDYNTEFKSDNQQTTYYGNAPFRASDHDPVIVGVAFDVVDNTEDTAFLLYPNTIKRGEQVNVKYTTPEGDIRGHRFQLFNMITGQREWGFNDYLAPTNGEEASVIRAMWPVPGIYIVRYVNPFTGEILGTSNLIVK